MDSTLEKMNVAGDLVNGMKWNFVRAPRDQMQNHLEAVMYQQVLYKRNYVVSSYVPR